MGYPAANAVGRIYTSEAPKVVAFVAPAVPPPAIVEFAPAAAEAAPVVTELAPVVVEAAPVVAESMTAEAVAVLVATAPEEAAVPFWGWIALGVTVVAVVGIAVYEYASQPEAASKVDDNVQVREEEKEDTDSKEKGPCDDLKKGNSDGEGDYRGGSYGGTKEPGIESHHMPPNSVSPLRKSQGPAIQMDPNDHHATSSHGWNGLDGVDYRQKISDLIEQGKWDEAMEAEIDDIRRVAEEAGDPERYEEAIKEMQAYFDCLKANGLL